MPARSDQKLSISSTENATHQKWMQQSENSGIIEYFSIEWCEAEKALEKKAGSPEI